MGALDTPANGILEVAIECAERGWFVLPCHNGSKRPLTENGLHDATRDVDQITKWFTRWPGAMVGVRTGPESGIFVVNCDVANGHDGVAELKRLLPDLPATIAVRTPRGGIHYYFTWPDNGTEVRNSTSKIAAEVNVRGTGGYVIGPGSRRSDGRYFEMITNSWPNGEPAPQRLLDLIAAASSKPSPAPAVAPQTDPTLAAFANAVAAYGRGNSGGNGAGYGNAALDGETMRAAGAAPGERNHTLNRARSASVSSSAGTSWTKVKFAAGYLKQPPQTDW